MTGTIWPVAKGYWTGEAAPVWGPGLAARPVAPETG